MIALAGNALRGSFTPLVTPFADGAVDLTAFEELVERQVDGDSHGVVVTGTTGEPTSLSAAERLSLYRRAVDTAAGRLPVVAATGSSNQADTVALTRDAQAAGVDAVLVVVPAFVRPSPDGLLEHYVTVAAATDLPVLIYNIPGRTGTAISGETVERICGRADNVVGLKSASADLDLVTDLLLRLGDEFRVFCGIESLSYPMLAVGAAGLMSAVGNLLPRPVAQLCDAVAEADHYAALAIHRELFALNQAIFFDTNPVPLKAMLELRGIASAEVRPPLANATPRLRARVEQVLARCASPAHGASDESSCKAGHVERGMSHALRGR